MWKEIRSRFVTTERHANYSISQSFDKETLVKSRNIRFKKKRPSRKKINVIKKRRVVKSTSLGDISISKGC